VLSDCSARMNTAASLADPLVSFAMRLMSSDTIWSSRLWETEDGEALSGHSMVHELTEQW